MADDEQHRGDKCGVWFWEDGGVGLVEECLVVPVRLGSKLVSELYGGGKKRREREKKGRGGEKKKTNKLSLTIPAEKIINARK